MLDKQQVGKKQSTIKHRLLTNFSKSAEPLIGISPEFINNDMIRDGSEMNHYPQIILKAL